LLIVDEAQNLALKVLEEIRLLSGVETTKDKVLRIILVGQPELNEKLDAPELVQLVQRIRLRFHLTPLTENELPAYLEHRLEIAGAHGRQIFDPESYPCIFRYTGGTPRLINTLCDTAMMSAFGARRDFVTLEDVTRSVAELKWVEFSRRMAPRGNQRAGARASVGRLLISLGGRTQAQHQLVMGRVGIGRTRDNDLQIKSRHISRHHAQIVSEENVSVLEDLNSTNGVYVGSERVRRCILSNGDVIQIGQHELIYIDDRQTENGETAGSEIPLRMNVDPMALDETAIDERESTLVGDDFAEIARK
jgi:hypothetical protein